MVIQPTGSGTFYIFRYLCIISIDFFIAYTLALALPQPGVIIDILVMVGFNYNIGQLNHMYRMHGKTYGIRCY